MLQYDVIETIKNTTDSILSSALSSDLTLNVDYFITVIKSARHSLYCNYLISKSLDVLEIIERFDIISKNFSMIRFFNGSSKSVLYKNRIINVTGEVLQMIKKSSKESIDNDSSSVITQLNAFKNLIDIITSYWDKYKSTGFFKKNEVTLITNLTNDLQTKLFKVNSDFCGLERVHEIFPDHTQYTQISYEEIKKSILDILIFFSQIDDFMFSQGWAYMRDECSFKENYARIKELRTEITQYYINLTRMVRDHPRLLEQIMEYEQPENDDIDQPRFPIAPMRPSIYRTPTHAFGTNRPRTMTTPRRSSEERSSQILNYLKRFRSQNEGKTATEVAAALFLAPEYVSSILKKLFNKHVLKRAKSGNEFVYWISDKGLSVTSNLRTGRTNI